MDGKKMIKKTVVFAFLLILIDSAASASVATVEVRGMVFDSSSSVYNTTLAWDAQKFPGFWYSAGGGKSSETLTIVNQPASSLTASSRSILEGNLQYNTSRTDQKYVMFSERGRKVQNGLEYNGTKRTFTYAAKGGYYARLGWFGDVYVAVNGKANKLSKLIKEQKKDEKQTLAQGAAWDLGEGYNLSVEALDSTTSPRQAWLSLRKEGNILDNRVVNEGEIYTYVQNLSGESDVPVFAAYVESIFTGNGTDLVQLRYTWLISQNVLDIRAGDKFGVFEVKEANENNVLLYNKDNSINLGQNSIQPLYGDLKFKIADSSTALRFYPLVEHNIQTLEGQNNNSSSASLQPVAVSVQTASDDVTSSQKTGASAAVSSDLPAGTSAISLQTDPEPEQWYWVLAVAGLASTGYFVLKKR